MTSILQRIINDKSLIKNQEQIIHEAGYKNRKTKKDIFNETLKWFKEDKPHLTDEELDKITSDFLKQIEIILK